MADWPWDLPAKLLSIFDCSAKEGSLVHKLFRNAANINTCATQTPLGACLKKKKYFHKPIFKQVRSLQIEVSRDCSTFNRRLHII